MIQVKLTIRVPQPEIVHCDPVLQFEPCDQFEKEILAGLLFFSEVFQPSSSEHKLSKVLFCSVTRLGEFLT